MPDHLTPVQRSRAMRRVKLKNGSLEKLVQGKLRMRGLRFRRHVRTLPGRPDIVFTNEKVAVFVDGDFCMAGGCRRGNISSRHFGAINSGRTAHETSGILESYAQADGRSSDCGNIRSPQILMAALRELQT